MSNINEDLLLNSVEKTVREAAKYADTAHIQIKEKGTSQNIVTSADINVQKYLVEHFRPLISGCGFYCEEENLKDRDKQYIWVIDPIDGTMNFSRGIADYCISVGLICNKEPLLGLVFIPSKNEMFTAYSGKGAFLNGKAIHVSDRPFDQGLLCTAWCTYAKEYAKTCFDITQEIYYQSNDIRRIGTCAEELCYLACGRCELYFEIKIQPWDYAGAYCILKEAGGYLSDLGAQKLTFDEPVVLIGANTKANFDKMNEIVSKHMAKKPYI